MPTFPAPHPVPVRVDVPAGSLHVVAGERDDVVVTVLPADPTKPGSVRAAEEVRVEHDGDAVTITYPASWKQYLLPFSAGTAAITVELPAGSHLSGKTGSVLAEGPLGEVDLALNGGDARIEEASRLTLTVAAGAVVVDRAPGPTSIKASAGSVRIGELGGQGTVRAANGATTVGSVTGDLTVTGAHSEIAVGRVRGTLTATAAHATIRVADVAGTVRLTTSYGSIEVGVPEGVAAWLDVASAHGTVRNHLTPTDGPVEHEATAEIHASTSYGDVIVRRP
ncbi:hypothetical protein DNL40_11045 [Xylanimonas oleitrophica]|uniref:DUF4097 domain-containing protein n=1 Tax=Xylanimonas oleitrophica TaxID=2607479 RepID=A0A2W5XS63_9MICO|nr:DUF4097 family beta strand repeat-containing protein [Xylanimonas oleitrophica]PZR52638.1 hypothetical protein DNL40_11045 [Xylanimonas oleitrophica]